MSFSYYRTRALPPLYQVLLTLRFYATGSVLRAAGDFCGVSVSTACRVVRKVSLALAQLRPRHIQMPRTRREILQEQVQFYRKFKFPKVIGCIDGTHVRIQSPGGENAELFRNRKGYFSINTQVICNSQMKIIDIVARWPGSAHDATMFTHSRIHNRFEAGEFLSGLLLGDSAYPSKNYLLTPLLNTNTPAEEIYNSIHIRTRNTVERVFGVWKRRFPILSTGMKVRLETIQAIIVATAVLHNIAIDEKDEEPRDGILIPEDIIVQNDVYQRNDRGNARRNALIAEYFARL